LIDLIDRLTLAKNLKLGDNRKKGVIVRYEVHISNCWDCDKVN